MVQMKKLILSTIAVILSLSALVVAPISSVSEAQGQTKSVEKTFWLNTNSDVRHNKSCRWYKNTKHGRIATKDEGRACKKCGG